MASTIRKGEIQIGEKLPEIEIMTAPSTKVKITDLFKGKRGILFGLPGAFTPTCSNTHLPEFVRDHAKWVELGYEIICCVSVNDAFVMEAWGKLHQVEGKVVMISDMNATLTRAIGLEIDLTDKLGSIRSKRYSMEVNDNLITSIHVESSLGATGCSTSSAMLGSLSQDMIPL
ncbi:Peroxiredoxin-5, mitochondrial-like [Oopsacas minuta]|uniref:Peroxiredoxin-5 n=1 Tax=Oopsacas minuta TaxID=111878 RepID=A0AAV7JSG7_9METZ|nr:Peroxiredoxin-5, mitochondrial-like [Oopsacas minuta]